MSHPTRIMSFPSVNSNDVCFRFQATNSTSWFKSSAQTIVWRCCLNFSSSFEDVKHGGLPGRKIIPICLKSPEMGGFPSKLDQHLLEMTREMWKTCCEQSTHRTCFSVWQYDNTSCTMYDYSIYIRHIIHIVPGKQVAVNFHQLYP